MPSFQEAQFCVIYIGYMKHDRTTGEGLVLVEWLWGGYD